MARSDFDLEMPYLGLDKDEYEEAICGGYEEDIDETEDKAYDSWRDEHWSDE